MSGMETMFYKIETEREDDGRWIAEVIDAPGVMCYGATRQEAVARAKALLLRVLADRIENSQSANAMTLSLKTT